jgi:hypothetical protein
MKNETLMKRVKTYAQCLEDFAHHEWIDSAEVTIRGEKYTAHRCGCGYIEVTSEIIN